MPVDRSQLNAVGDIVVTEPKALRVLADPVNLHLFDLVRRLGPAGAADLATELGEHEAATHGRLVALESAYLVDLDDADPERVLWSTPASGIYFEIPEDGAEAQEAARALSNVMFAGASELPRRWVEGAEPQLTVEWARAAGLFNARVELSPEEVRGLQDSIERLLEPFTTREAGKRPAGAVPVRLLAFFMPEPQTQGEHR